MKTRIGIVLALAMVIAVQCGYAQKKGQSVHGNIVEVNSYITEQLMPSGGASTEIAMGSLRKGGMLGIVQLKTKKLYLLVPTPGDTAFTARATAYFGTNAFVTGTLYSRGGVNMLTLEDIGKSMKK